MKRLCGLFAGIMTVVTVILFLCSCGAPVSKNVSERRCGYYCAGDGSYEVTAVSGAREVPYEPDGAVGELVPYTLITVSPADKSKYDPDAVIAFEAALSSAGDKRYGGTLIAHPFAASFSAELPFEAEEGEIKLTLKCGGTSSAYVLRSSVTESMLTYDRAIVAAKNELGEPDGLEVRVKLIKNPLGRGLCWHVEYIGPGVRQGVLLDAENARVLAKKG